MQSHKLRLNLALLQAYIHIAQVIKIIHLVAVLKFVFLHAHVLLCFTYSADCIANYGNHPENKQEGQLGSETAIYTDVNLSNKLSEIKTFNNSNLCYASPGGDSAATYEPIPYATTQLIQASIKNKAASGGSIAEPLDIPCWKQPPNLPPIPKEMAAQMQYNLTEQKSNGREDHLDMFYTIFI